MMHKRVTAYLLAIFSLLLGGYFLYSLDLLGFPDGHLTEYEEALEIMYPVCTGISFLFTQYFFMLGWNAQRISKFLQPKWGLILFIVFLATAFILNYYLGLHLEHGQGG